MFNWLCSRKTKPRSTKPVGSNRVRLALETLESRYCPSSLNITSFSVAVLTGHNIQLSGTVSGTGTGLMVNFSGVASGSTSVNSNGSFSLQTQANSLGTIYAQAGDMQMDMSPQVQTQLSVPAPTITLYINQTQGSSSVLLSGVVSAQSPGGLMVGFDGVVTGSTDTTSTGSFSFSATVTGSGAIYASALDSWGQMSNIAQVTATSPQSPTITFTIAQGANRTVTISGQVTDPSPNGLTVNLSGVVSGTATTNSTGSFTFTGPASALGTINASVTDSAGLTGSASNNLTDSPPVISNFTDTYDGETETWTFTGLVTAGYAPGLIVTLSGVPGVGNVTITVGSNGYFTYSVILAANASGPVSATTTDWWGETSNAAMVYVN